MNSTGLGSYSRNHLAMVSTFEGIQKIIAFTPRIRIYDERLSHPKIYPSVPTSIWKIAPGLWRRLALGKRAQRIGANIYHGLSAELPFDIDRFTGRKILTVHDVLFKTRPYDYSPLDRTLYDYKLRQALDAADLVHCISRQTMSELVTHYHIRPARCRVIYQSVHPDFYSASDFRYLVTPPFGRFILSVGTIEPRKNTLSLLRAIDHLKIPIVLVGRIKKRYEREIYPIYNRLRQNNLLYHANPKDTNELAAWYAHASMVVYPSVAEGFGLPPLEAAAAGKVCVTGPSPCLIEASGLPECQTSGKTEDLIHTIEKLWNNDFLRNELSAKAYHHALNLTPEKSGYEWMKVYSSLMSI
ncbi:MAG: glycosyltransferase family 4 protein [Thermaurantimonas sp.]